eukprot:758256-Hanusia_phi.AAC.2
MLAKITVDLSPSSFASTGGPPVTVRSSDPGVGLHWLRVRARLARRRRSPSPVTGVRSGSEARPLSGSELRLGSGPRPSVGGPGPAARTAAAGDNSESGVPAVTTGCPAQRRFRLDDASNRPIDHPITDAGTRGTAAYICRKFSHRRAVPGRPARYPGRYFVVTAGTKVPTERFHAVGEDGVGGDGRRCGAAMSRHGDMCRWTPI